jgi:hypothetical protein
MLDSLFNYVEQGARLSAGFWPLSPEEIARAGLAPAGPGVRYESWGPHIFRNSIEGGVANRVKMPEVTGHKLPAGRLGGYGMAGLGVAGSAYNVYLGAKEGGMGGAINAAYTDVAVMAASNAVLFPKSTLPNISKVKPPGMIKGFSTMGMGFMGAQMGGEIAGIPGTFFGAIVGAKMGRHPVITAAAIGLGMVGNSVVKNGVNYLKAGYQRERMKRRIDTAGSTASFMTGNAFTQRQRAVSAMQNSHLNARSAMGMEATYMHQPRDYFSNYRRM